MWLDVPTIDAGRFGPCDVLKVDTEGSEVEILEGYRHLNDVKVLLVESHAVGGNQAGQIKRLKEIASAAGFSLLEDTNPMRFVR